MTPCAAGQARTAWPAAKAPTCSMEVQETTPRATGMQMQASLPHLKMLPAIPVPPLGIPTVRSSGWKAPATMTFWWGILPTMSCVAVSAQITSMAGEAVT